MADVPDVTPGKETSEFSLRKLVMIVGSVVTGLGAVLTALSQAGVGDKWVGPALVVFGVLTKLVNAAGYQSGREEFKAAALNAAAFAGDSASDKLLGPESEAVIDRILAQGKAAPK